MRCLVGVLLLGLWGCQSSSEQDCQPTPSSLHQIEGEQVQVPSKGYVQVLAARGDLNGDGNADLVDIVRFDGGGSGSFYYLSANLAQGCDWQPQESVFLGDRIGLDGLSVIAAEVRVSMRVRGDAEPMATPAHIAVERRFRLTELGLAAVD
ncbi:hypothetical protein SAMN04488540_109119 [Ferrimonas sediminum]|uniref:VCBS repeat-containing protein n=1 Tax=Ferrimonas sediminum TaxID=718193 RepID=A0A1G8UKG6_9GAMM|nr:hypothetical protein [Ferrimonas sediminum]SDJ54259.1 hypothetical protein SAMN04488540_109119 [Ferrimonas sediminum]